MTTHKSTGDAGERQMYEKKPASEKLAKADKSEPHNSGGSPESMRGTDRLSKPDQKDVKQDNDQQRTVGNHPADPNRQGADWNLLPPVSRMTTFEIPAESRSANERTERLPQLEPERRFLLGGVMLAENELGGVVRGAYREPGFQSFSSLRKASRRALRLALYACQGSSPCLLRCFRAFWMLKYAARMSLFASSSSQATGMDTGDP